MVCKHCLLTSKHKIEFFKGEWSIFDKWIIFTDKDMYTCRNFKLNMTEILATFMIDVALKENIRKIRIISKEEFLGMTNYARSLLLAEIKNLPVKKENNKKKIKKNDKSLQEKQHNLNFIEKHLVEMEIIYKVYKEL